MLAQADIVFRILADRDEIEAVGEQWRALEDRCRDPLAYFQSYDWCNSWLAQYGGDSRHEAHIATLWRADRLIAVWPLMIGHAGGIRRLMMLGTPHSQYCDLLAEPSLGQRDLAWMVRQALDRSGCDVAVFRTVPGGSVLSRALGDMAVVHDAGDVASMLDLSVFASSDDYAAQLGKLQKRNRNRRRNHLARHGELEFDMVWPGDSAFRELVERCADWKQQWLTELGLYSAGFAMTGFESFLASLSGDAETHSGACISVLRVGGAPVAIELGFIRQGHYYAYMGGFDWSLRALSPGKVQMDMTVCWLIDHGILTYDLLGNSADYKKSWSNRNIAVTCHAEALTWKGQVYASAWLPKVRPALKRLRNQLPLFADRATALARGAACLLLYV